MTIGFALIFQDLALLIWGGDPYTIPVPPLLSGVIVRSARCDVPDLPHLHHRRGGGGRRSCSGSRSSARASGAMIRAAVDDAEMAQGVGINVPRAVAGRLRARRRARRARRRDRRRLPRRLPRARTSRCCPTRSSWSSSAGWAACQGAMVGQPPGRAARQLRQGALPRAVLLHAVRADGADPRPPADRALRPRVMDAARRWRRALGRGRSSRSCCVGAARCSSYPLTLLTQALIVAILAMSLDVLLGYTGLPSLGHAAYFGVGAYARRHPDHRATSAGFSRASWPASLLAAARPPRSSACSPSAPPARTS